MYDPTVGRFITEDPIGFDGRDTNLYRYCGNSPTNATDPTGMATPTEHVPPIGTFTVTMKPVSVRDPEQQLKLGGESSVGYTITYTPPANYTVPAGYRIVLVQAIRAKGFVFGGQAVMDINKKKEYDHKLLPPYPGQGGPSSITDRPFNPRWPGGGTTYEGTVCAVAQRIGAPTGENDEIILGALNYMWYDMPGKEYLMVDGKTLHYTNGKLTPATVNAVKPGAVWYKALKAWNQPPQ